MDAKGKKPKKSEKKSKKRPEIVQMLMNMHSDKSKSGKKA